MTQVVQFKRGFYMQPNSNGRVAIIIDDQLSNIGGQNYTNNNFDGEIFIHGQKLIARLEENNNYDMTLELIESILPSRPADATVHTTTFVEFYYEAQRISEEQIIRGISKIDDDSELKTSILDAMVQNVEYVIEFEWQSGDTFNWYFWELPNS